MLEQDCLLIQHGMIFTTIALTCLVSVDMNVFRDACVCWIMSVSFYLTFVPHQDEDTLTLCSENCTLFKIQILKGICILFIMLRARESCITGLNSKQCKNCGAESLSATAIFL